MEGIKQSYRNITQYGLSLRFFVLHDYYVNGWCPDFSFQPTAETLEKLRNFRFKYRNLENGIELALDMHHDFSNPIFQQEQIFNFTFRNNNPFFLQFTDMPFVSSGMMLFDSSDAYGESLHEASTIQAQDFMKTGKDGLNGVFRVRHQPAKPLWGREANRINIISALGPERSNSGIYFMVLKIWWIFFQNLLWKKVIICTKLLHSVHLI